MKEIEDLLSADKAIEDPRYDRLEYSPFAKNLAESILKMAPIEGFVIAIYGPWGSGKTSFLNFMQYYLNRMPERPVIVVFNPWWFSGTENIKESSLIK